MASNHDMQAQRYELKYIVPVTLTEPLREFVQSYLELDDFSAAADDSAYPIHSIYFDSDSLSTYQATENGDRNRFKLRLRYYDDKPQSPVFLEMKRRFNDVIQKRRCMLPRHAIQAALAGDTTEVRQNEMEGYRTFMHLKHHLDAKPKAHVAYLREAWMSHFDNSVRVTMDREVRVEPKFDLVPTTQMKSAVSPFGEQMVLELKYTTRFPQWFQDLARTFHLVQTGGPKYSGGVKLLGADHFFAPGIEPQMNHREIRWERPPSEGRSLQTAMI